MTKKRSYQHEQIYAGVPFVEPKGVFFKLACCHCGLVHEVKIEDVPESQHADSVYLTMRENASYTKRYREANDEELICTLKTSNLSLDKMSSPRGGPKSLKSKRRPKKD